MTIAALIPFKDLASAKSRLAQVLTEPERRKLARQMLEHVVDALKSTKGIGSITVLSPTEPEDLTGIQWLRDDGGGLNPEIQNAMRTLGASKVLIIHADIPNVAAQDIEAVIAAARDHDIGIAKFDEHI